MISADALDLLGYLAAVLTTGSFVPQAWHTLRTRDVSGISAGMYTAFTLGVALWLAYGVLQGAWPIIVANTIALPLAGTILAVKLGVVPGGADQNRYQSPVE